VPGKVRGLLLGEKVLGEVLGEELCLVVVV
jgi:hypothetical protein